MSGPLTCGGGINVTGIPGAGATPNFTYLTRGPFKIISNFAVPSTITGRDIFRWNYFLFCLVILSRWRHNMWCFSHYGPLWARIWSSGIIFDISLKPLNKQSSGWWLKTPWRTCEVALMILSALCDPHDCRIISWELGKWYNHIDTDVTKGLRWSYTLEWMYLGKTPTTPPPHSLSVLISVTGDCYRNTVDVCLALK